MSFLNIIFSLAATKSTLAHYLEDLHYVTQKLNVFIARIKET